MMNFDAVIHQISRYLAEDRVPVNPSLQLRSMIAGRDDLLCRTFPFDQEGNVLTFSASGAIYQAAKLLALSAGENVLCPAYNCGHEIEPFLHENVNVKFFSVNEDLQVDVDHLQKQIDRKTRAILVTHYFGFPQQLERIRAICDEQGLFLIEDCAHSLYSRDGERPLGTAGELAVFSIRKSLPIPNGGLLVINTPRLQSTAKLSRPPAITTWSKIFDLWAASLRSVTPGETRSLAAAAQLVVMLPLVVVRKLVRRLPIWNPLVWHDPDDEGFPIDRGIYTWQMASVGQRIAKSFPPDLIVSRRRSNYEYLLNALRDTESAIPIFRALPRGACPLYFPIVVDEPERMVQDLARQKIGAIRWWGTFHPAVDWEKFPRESFLKRHVVALPVHQDLTHRHLQAVVEAIRREPRDCDRSLGTAVRT